MAIATRTTAIAAFANQEQAAEAVRQLLQANFREGQIGYASQVPDSVEAAETAAEEEGATVGATTGGVIGALLGGIAALTIPGLGPVIAAGVIAGIVAGAGIGAGAGGFLGSMSGAAIPDEELRYYEEALRAGRTLVLVRAGDRFAEAVDILHHCGGTYMDPAEVTPY